jgi:hypothetical protein
MPRKSIIGSGSGAKAMLHSIPALNFYILVMCLDR